MWQLVRNPTHYSRLVLLLMLATAVGMFAASFGATLDRSYADRAAYQSGSQLRVSEIRRTPANGPNEMLDTMRTTAGASNASPVLRLSGSQGAGFNRNEFALLGVDTKSFAGVGYFRDDFAANSLRSLMSKVAPSENPKAGPVDHRGCALARRLGESDRPQGPRRYRRLRARRLRALLHVRAGAGRRCRAAAGLELPGRRPDAGVARRFAGQHAVRQRTAAGPVRGRLAVGAFCYARLGRQGTVQLDALQSFDAPGYPARWRPTAC